MNSPWVAAIYMTVLSSVLLQLSAATVLPDACLNTAKTISIPNFNKGVLTSPNYPDNYDNYQELCWTLQSGIPDPEGEEKIFINFNLEEVYLDSIRTKCLDFVGIYMLNNGTPSIVEHEDSPICTTDKLPVKAKSDHKLQIYFHSDDQDTYKGFSGHYYLTKVDAHGNVVGSAPSTSQSPFFACLLFTMVFLLL